MSLDGLPVITIPKYIADCKTITGEYNIRVSCIYTSTLMGFRFVGIGPYLPRGHDDLWDWVMEVMRLP